jgi:aspartyl protease family protein
MWPIFRNFFLMLSLAALGLIGLNQYSGLFDPAPAQPARAAAGDDSARQDNDWTLEIEPGARGHFRVEAEINGETEEFLVDTGASMVSFSLDTAERLGFDEALLDFNARSRTANGMVAIALVTLDEVTVGELSVRDVPAAIRRTRTGPSLLGMSFLRRLDGYEVRQGKLVLRW